MACHHQGGSEGGVNEQKQFVHFWLIKLDSKSYWSSYCVSQPLSKATAVKVAESPLKFSPTCSGHMISWQVKSVKISVIAHDSVAIAFGSRHGGSSLELPQFSWQAIISNAQTHPNPLSSLPTGSYWFGSLRWMRAKPRKQNVCTADWLIRSTWDLHCRHSQMECPPSSVKQANSPDL